MDLTGVGVVVRDARRAAGLSQKELARLAGVSRATVNYLENEPDSDMGAIKLLALLDVLGISLRLAPASGEADSAAVASALATIAKKERLAPGVLVEAFITGRPPVGQMTGLVAFLDGAPVHALLAGVRLASAQGGVSPKAVWKNVRELAQSTDARRPEWGKLG